MVGITDTVDTVQVLQKFKIHDCSDGQGVHYLVPNAVDADTKKPVVYALIPEEENAWCSAYIANHTNK